MRVAIVGASGRIGRQLVRRAAEAGHEVTAVVRDSPGAAAAIREWERRPVAAGSGAAAGRVRVAVVRGLDAAELTDPVTGRDAVLSALGPPGRTADPTINSRGVRATIEAMRAAGTRRVVAVSAAPVGPVAGPLPYRAVVRPLLWRLFGEHYADLTLMERLLRDSGLDWTVVRPPRLTDGPATGRQRIALEAAARGIRVSRADVAAAMLDLLPDPASHGHAYGVA